VVVVSPPPPPPRSLGLLDEIEKPKSHFVCFQSQVGKHVLYIRQQSKSLEGAVKG